MGSRTVTGSGFSVEPKLIRAGMLGKSTGGAMTIGNDACRGSRRVPGVVTPFSVQACVVTSRVSTSSAMPGCRSSTSTGMGTSMSPLVRSSASVMVSSPAIRRADRTVSSDSVSGSIRAPLRSTVPSCNATGSAPICSRTARSTSVGAMSPFSVIVDLASSSVASEAMKTMPHGPAQSSASTRVRSKVSTWGVSHSQASVEPPRFCSPVPCVSSMLSPVRVLRRIRVPSSGVFAVALTAPMEPSRTNVRVPSAHSVSTHGCVVVGSVTGSRAVMKAKIRSSTSEAMMNSPGVGWVICPQLALPVVMPRIRSNADGSRSTASPSPMVATSSERSWSARPPGRHRSLRPASSAWVTCARFASLLSGAHGLRPPQRCSLESLSRTLRLNSPSENHISRLQGFSCVAIRSEKARRAPSMADQ